MSKDILLTKTRMLDFDNRAIQHLINTRGWRRLPLNDRIGASYNFVRDEIRFGYNALDTLSASEILSDGYGQCNTKATLLMALFRGLGIRCRLHGFTIDRGLQRGVVPEAAYWMTPKNILHSWVEIDLDGQWINLEGFILDTPVLEALKAAFPDRNSLCAYGAGTDDLQNPEVLWNGSDTYIQKTGINQDFGIFDAPDDFYRDHHQELTGIRGILHRNFIRHWMNRRLANMRLGHVPPIPGGPDVLVPGFAPVPLLVGETA